MGSTVFRNAMVLDPARGELVSDQNVVVVDGTIAEISSSATTAIDATVVDLRGMTLMPGLIDSHTHPMVVDMDVTGQAEWPPTYVTARAARALKGMLMRGFTTIRDAGGGDFGLARAVAEDLFLGPRVFYGGKQLTQTGGAGDWRGPGRRVYDDNYYAPGLGVICDGVTEVRRAVREEVRRGAHHIKVYLSGAVDSPTDRVDSTQFSIEELLAMVEEADAANIYVTGHAYTSRAINRGLECGVRCIEHGNLMDESSIPFFKKYDAFYVPTLTTYRGLASLAEKGEVSAEISDKLAAVLDHGLGALELAHRNGLKIAYGTDLFADLHDRQLDEFLLRTEVQTPADVIRSATIVGADLLRQTGRLGVIAPGALADILVVDGNPLDDITVLTTPNTRLKLIMKQGKIYKSDL